MNIQLFLSNQEVDLTEEITFPITRTYSNLSSPADIITDFTKTVNIPMTAHNNEIFGHIYNVRKTNINDPINIGVKFNPYKRIPFKLVYNGDVLLEGYARYQSSVQTGKKGFYKINLYGQLGEIFLTLQNIKPEAFDKYFTGRALDYSFARESFIDDDPRLDLNSAMTTDIVGLAPSYRGFYDNFDSESLETSTGIKKMEDVLREHYKDTYADQIYHLPYISLTDEGKAIVDEYVENIDMSQFEGGLKDYQMNEYRSYQLRPYIYINKLWQMYQQECYDLTGYTLDLSPTWFSVNNPYYARLCYMCDFLNVQGTKIDDKGVNLEGGDLDEYKAFSVSPTSGILGQTTTYVPISSNIISTSNQLIINKIPVDITHTAVYGNDIFMTGDFNNRDFKPEFSYNVFTYYRFDIQVRDSSNITRTKTFWSASNPEFITTQHISGIDETNFCPLNFSSVSYSSMNSYEGNPPQLVGNTAINMMINTKSTIPEFYIDGDYSNGGAINITTTVRNSFDDNIGTMRIPEHKRTWTPIIHPTIGPETRDVYVNSYPVIYEDSAISGYTEETYPYYHSTHIGNISITTSKKNIPLNISTLFNETDKPLFNILLQYSKMFNLIWDIDYEHKKVTVQPRGEYFSNPIFEDWSSKLDMSREYIVEPVPFPYKYMSFDYEDVDGAYRYTAYQNKYERGYGSVKIGTPYQFNEDSHNILDGYYPSISSNRSFFTYEDIYDWDLQSIIKGHDDDLERIESANDDDSGPVILKNWFFRGYNIRKDCLLTDDSLTQQSNEKYCYYDPHDYPSTAPVIECYEMPVFTAAFSDSIGNFDDNYYGLLWATPNEDYTTNNRYFSCNGSYVYQRFWQKYINERYNSDNICVTAYFRLTPKDFIDFKFYKFVTFNNTLWCVNKIFDYNIKDLSTKVELLSVSNVGAYNDTSMNFPALYATPPAIDIMDTQNYGSRLIKVHSNVLPTITLTSTTGPTSGRVYIENVEHLSYDWTEFDLTYEDLASNDEFEGQITITAGSDSLVIPVRISIGTFYTYTLTITEPETAEIYLTVEDD